MARTLGVFAGIALAMLIGASGAGAATLAYTPGDFTSAVTVDDGASTYSGTAYRDSTGQRLRLDTNRSGGVRKTWTHFDKLLRYIESPDGRCFRTSVVDTADAALVADDQGNVVTDFVQDGTIEIEGETLDRWVGSSGGEQIIAGVGPVPGGAGTTVRYVETPLGSTFYEAPFVAGRPAPSSFTLPVACVDDPTPPFPDVEIATPADGATYAHSEAVVADYTCTANDAALKPGAEGCDGPAADGARVDTGAPGTHKFTVTATQRDELATSATATYTVADAIPRLAGTASPSVAVGGSVSDIMSLHGGYRPGGGISFRLHGPDDETCTGAPVFADTVAVNGAGDYGSAAFVARTPGTYRWSVEYSGDEHNEPAEIECGAAGQSVTVVPAELRIMRIDRDTAAGTAALTVDFNADGGLWIDKTRRVAPVAWRGVAGPGSAQLEVVPRGKAKKRLERTGKVTINPRVVFAPDAGGRIGERIKVKLRLD